MVAGALTKSLPTLGLERHRSVMMGHSDVPSTAFARGSCWLNFFGLLKSTFLLPTISHGAERLSQR
jgi:hypothetical protein